LFIIGFMNRLFRALSVILIAAAFSIFAYAEDKPAAKKTAATSGELFETIARMDGVIFDAFNAHDVDRLMALFTDDLEFYHDTGGLADNRQTGEGFKKTFAGTPDTRRDLLKETLEVYPVKDYGAMEIGEQSVLLQGEWEGRLRHLQVRHGLAEARGVVEDFPGHELGTPASTLGDGR
jgi:ketosteroid isomerase-like protein